jgi:hypothetical protein
MLRSRLLLKKSASPKTMAKFYKAIVQSVLLYGSESWVLSAHSIRKLESFHRRCPRCITGRHIHPNEEGIWIYPSSAETLEIAGLLPIDECIRRRVQTVLESVQTREIYKSCLDSQPLARVPSWWEQYLTSLALTPRRPVNGRLQDLSRSLLTPALTTTTS